MKAFKGNEYHFKCNSETASIRSLKLEESSFFTILTAAFCTTASLLIDFWPI